jgi:hypothetical protein
MTYVRRRSLRARKAPIATVPLRSSEAGPPDPRPIEQPAVLATGLNENGQPRGGHQYYPGRDTIAPPSGIPRNIPDALEDVEDIGQLAPTKGKGRSLSVHLPARHLEVLEWAAAQRGQTVADLAAEMLRGPLAGLRSDFKRAQSGERPATVRRSEMGAIIGGE